MKPRYLALFVLAALAAGSAHAATFKWTNLAGGSWATAGNWDNAPTGLADDILDFSTLNITTNAITTLDGNRTAGSLKFGDASTVSNTWTVNPGTGGTLTLAATATPTIDVVDFRHVANINAEIAGIQGFTKTGAGTLVLGGTNSYSGTTAINAGILSFATPAAIPATSSITVASTATLALRTGTGGFTAENLDSLFAKSFPNVTLNAASRVGIDTTTADFTYGSNLSGTFGLAKVGGNKLTISGTNSYTGGTFVTAPAGVTNSVIDVSGDQSAANGGWEIRAGATVNFLAGSTVAVANGKSITLSNDSVATHTLNVAGAVTGTGSLSVNAGSVLNINSGAVWTQNGNMSIQPNQSFATPMMNVNGGQFTYTGASAISLSSSISTNGGSATLNLNGGTFTTGMAFNNSTVASATAGGANLNFNGGTLRLSANIASLATTVARPFAVQLGTNGGIIDTNGFTTTLALAATNVPGQTGSLTKQGAGTLTLSGTNTYSGTTSVTGGMLLINGANNGVGLVSVAAGATLGGTGSTAAPISISGVLSPGASIESLSSGALSMAAGSTFRFEALNNSSTGADLMVVNGDLALGGVTLDLTAANFGLGSWVAGDKLTLLSYTGTALTGGFNGLADDSTTTIGANTWRIDYNDSVKGANFASEATGNQFVTFTVVPEPATALLGALGLLGPLRRRRN